MAVSTVSYSKTPQAGDDVYSHYEDWFNSNFTRDHTILWDVLADDQGGNAKRLYSIDDGAAGSALKDLLASDVGKTLVSAWENTAGGNQIRINNGKIEFKFAQDFDINSLRDGENYSDTFNYAIQLGNGTISCATVTINVTGGNDSASIQGNALGTVTEDGSLAATGKLTVADVDRDEAHAKAYSKTIDEGTFAVDEDGNWSFDLDNDAVQHLAKDATLTRTFAVESLDGTASQDVTITITGANDTPVLAAALTAAGNEDGNPITVDLLAGATDADDGAQLGVAGVGSLPSGVSVVGHTLTVDPTHSAFQHLAAGATENILVAYQVTDEHGAAVAQTATVTLTGVNDDASIGGTATGEVKEDGTLAATGKLDVADIDDGQAHAKAYSATIGEGTFSVDADGNWSFELNNDAVQHLAANSPLTRTFAVESLDGTASRDVTITIAGADEPVVRAAAPAVHEGADTNDFDGAGAGPLATLVTYTNNQLNGDNVIRGTNGSDTIDARSGGDAVYGYGGGDTLDGGQGVDSIYGGAGGDTIRGDSQVDTIYGGSGNDTIYGGSDDDRLYGGSGNDTIFGDSQNDIIVGGFGADTLAGNDGADIYKFLSAFDTGDTIAFATGDKLDFSAIDANLAVPDDDGFAFSTAPSQTLLANGINWFHENGSTVVQFDNDGNTATAEFEIKLTGTLTLTQADFVL